MFNSFKFNTRTFSGSNVPSSWGDPILLLSHINSDDPISLSSAIDSAGIISLESNLN